MELDYRRYTVGGFKFAAAPLEIQDFVGGRDVCQPAAAAENPLATISVAAAPIPIRSTCKIRRRPTRATFFPPGTRPSYTVWLQRSIFPDLDADLDRYRVRLVSKVKRPTAFAIVFGWYIVFTIGAARAWPRCSPENAVFMNHRAGDNRPCSP